MDERSLLVTGGAGFIGSSFVRAVLAETDSVVVNLDLLTYAGNRASLDSLPGQGRHVFVRGDIRDRGLLDVLLRTHRPRGIVHLAAESHVDRSIDSPERFVSTNVAGAACVLEAARAYWTSLSDAAQRRFRFLHVSTDEVYGALPPGEPATVEGSPYAPSSPYAATKAASDHLARAYHHTHRVPTVVVNTTNNYGPRQHPEKLIPVIILRALAGRAIPIYGDGQQTRDWLHVDDHCTALRVLLERGVPGEQYHVGAQDERQNLATARTICDTVDQLLNRPAGASARLIQHVRDRPGHDRRYSLNAEKIKRLGWRPRTPLDAGLRAVVDWYSTNRIWLDAVATG